MQNQERRIEKQSTPLHYSVLSSWLSSRAPWLLASGVAFYIVVFVAAACYKYWASWMGFDLAVHLQVLWNTAHGRIAASSPSAGTNSYFGIDIIISELLLAPLFRLLPSVYPLLALETIVLAFGAVPVYLFARERLQTPFAGLVFAAAYLLYAPVEWMNLYEFQIRAFATTFLLCALYALYRHRVGWFLLWVLLALGCRSDVGLVVAGMGICGLIECGTRNKGLETQSKFKTQHLVLGSCFLVLLGLGWTLLCVLVLVPSFRIDGQFLYVKVIYGWLGDTPSAMLRRLLTDPGYVLGYVFGPPHGGERLRYLLEMFLPFAFLPLLAPRRLLPALPIFALNLLSNTPNIHATTQKHYQALIIPFMLVAAIEGMALITKEARGEQREARSSYHFLIPHFSLLAFRSLLCSLLFILALGCNLGFRNPFFSLLTRQLNEQRNAAAADLIKLVPPMASVAATNSLGPPVAQREQLYVFPGDDIIYPIAYAQRADYLLVDTAELTSVKDRAYFDQVRTSGRYRLVDSRGYSERGQSQELSVWQKVRVP